MSYNSVETSINSSQPILLLDFEQGGSHNRFTNYDKEYIHNTFTYEPSSFTISNIRQDSDPFKSDFSFRFPISNQFAFSLLLNNQEDQVFVDIYRGHISEVSPEFVIIKKGRIIGRELSGLGITLTFESNFSRLKDIGLPAKYEYGCRHRLYSSNCGLNKASYAVNASVSSVSSNGFVLNSSTFDSYSDSYFNAGIVEHDGIKRFIQSHSSSTITLMTPFNIDLTGEFVVVYPGCDRTLDTCASKFNNSINHGGAPFMPKKNPFGSSLL